MIKIIDGKYKGLLVQDMGLTKKGNPVVYHSKFGIIYCALHQVEKLD